MSRLIASAEKAGSPAFRAAYAGIPRRLGGDARQPAPPLGELAHLARPHWTLADVTRAFAVILAFTNSESRAHAAIVSSLLEGGEIGEQESLLRTLILLPGAEGFTETALAGCRTNALRVFEAIAGENAFPARHFPELGFNQMVLKAIFMQVPVARIEGLSARITPELARMVEAYASERRAAGRAVPEDVDWILSGGMGAVT